MNTSYLEGNILTDLWLDEMVEKRGRLMGKLSRCFRPSVFKYLVRWKEDGPMLKDEEKNETI